MSNQTLSRSRNGIRLAVHKVVPADIIALVSGVNLASVNKVILAMNVVADGLHVSIPTLADTASLPADRAEPGGERYENTESIAQELMHTPEAVVAEPMLHFIDRMSRH